MEELADSKTDTQRSMNDGQPQVARCVGPQQVPVGCVQYRLLQQQVQLGAECLQAIDLGCGTFQISRCGGQYGTGLLILRRFCRGSFGSLFVCVGFHHRFWRWRSLPFEQVRETPLPFFTLSYQTKHCFNTDPVVDS